MKKSRCFSMVLYPYEDDKHQNVLDYITSNFEFAYIEHNFDKYEEDTEEHKKGDFKKAHIHVIIYFKNARTVKSVSEELGLEHVETCNFYAYSRYLTHLGYPNKYQYNPNEIKTNMEIRIKNALKRDYNSEEQDSRILLDFIFSRNFTTFQDLTRFALENDCLGELQKRAYFYNLHCDNYKM